MATCKDIANEINGGQILKVHFCKIEKKLSSFLKLSVATKWGSVLFCLKSLF